MKSVHVATCSKCNGAYWSNESHSCISKVMPATPTEENCTVAALCTLVGKNLQEILNEKRKLEELNAAPEDLVLAIPSANLFNMRIVFSDNITKACVVDKSKIKL
jgi:hypothetical protein